MQPPAEIDGALVLEWAWSDSPFGYMRSTDGSIDIAIHGFALCRYAGSTDIYRFSCNRDWEPENDSLYPSTEVAKSCLPPQYNLAAPKWVRAT